MLEREREKLTIDRLRTELRARYDLLKERSRRRRLTLLFLLLERSGEIADAVEKNTVMPAAINKRMGGVRGKIVMVRAVAAVRVVATELHPGSKVDPHAATSARRRGTSGSSAPSGYVVSAARLATIPIPALRL